MNKIKVPKQLFVVFHTGKPPVGFLHEYSPNTSTGQKKMNTQLEWGLGHNGSSCIVEKDDNDVWIKRGYTWKYPSQGSTQTQAIKQEYLEVIPPEKIPQVWDNVPMVGFKIITSVSRYSTSNKLWKILDPRGYVFEVSTVNFEKIVRDGTIDRGEIMNECIWVGNKNLALADSI